MCASDLSKVDMLTEFNKIEKYKVSNLLEVVVVNVSKLELVEMLIIMFRLYEELNVARIAPLSASEVLFDYHTQISNIEKK